MSEGQDRTKQIQETLDMLQRASLSRETIAMLTARLVELENPGKKAEFGSNSSLTVTNPDGSSFTMNLHNMWAECDQTPEERSEIVARYVRIITSEMNSESAPVQRENIVALIRDSVYRDCIAEDERELITRHLVGDLWVVYAVDQSEATDVLRTSEAVSLGLDANSLLELSTRNVDKLLGQIDWEPYCECYSLSCDDVTYAASVLLLNHVWERARTFINGDPIVAVPARDTVLLADSQNREALKNLRDEVEYVMKTGHHIVTDSLLRWRNGAWELFA